MLSSAHHISLGKPSGRSSLAADVDGINAAAQPSDSHGLAPTSTAEDALDEPPCSGRQATYFPLTINPRSASSLSPATLSATSPDPSSSGDNRRKSALITEKPSDQNACEKSLCSRIIRFKIPLAMPRLSKQSRLRALFTPTRPIGPAPSYGRSFINIFRFSPLNVLLVFVPISWALHFANQSDSITFAMSALAILPLAALLGFATEQVAIRTSSAVAGLLNASLGNLTELIIAGICLSRCQLQLIQSSLLGGLLSNLLLVLGMAFVVGGFRYPQLCFGSAAAQVNASLLTVGVISMLLPTAFVSSLLW